MDQGEGSAGPVPPPYFLTKLRPEGAEKYIFLQLPPPLSQGLDDHPPPPLNLSEGLLPPAATETIDYKVLCRGHFLPLRGWERGRKRAQNARKAIGM